MVYSVVQMEKFLQRRNLDVNERNMNALRLLEKRPEMTQREIAAALGVSLGAANYCLKALIDRGWLKLGNFQKNPR